MSTVYLVNLLRLTFKTPKKSSLLSPPLCSSNIRVCFHTMRSVSTVRNTFLKSSLSILFRLLHFPVPRFQRPPFNRAAVVQTLQIPSVRQRHTRRDRPIPKRRRNWCVLCREMWPIALSATGAREYYQTRSKCNGDRSGELKPKLSDDVVQPV